MKFSGWAYEHESRHEPTHRHLHTLPCCLNSVDLLQNREFGNHCSFRFDSRQGWGVGDTVLHRSVGTI